MSEVEVSDLLVLLELLRIGTARYVGRQFHSSAEPPVCSDEECESTYGKREASRKRLTIMLYLFPAIAILLALLTAI